MAVCVQQVPGLVEVLPKPLAFCDVLLHGRCGAIAQQMVLFLVMPQLVAKQGGGADKAWQAAGHGV